MSRKEHWEAVYGKKEPNEVSWYQREPTLSLKLIDQAVGGQPASVIDVGGGASLLVDRLLDRPTMRVTVLDLSGAALRAARQRLGPRAAKVNWIEADILNIDLPEGAYDIWHDRAVFHFLTDAAARAAYLAQVHRSVKPGGHVMVATFGLDGPERCSGLPVARYDAAGIHAVFGDAFVKVDEASEVHATPWGSSQAFVYCFCRRA